MRLHNPLCGVVATLVTMHAASAHWARPEPMPVARLVENLSAYTREHPEDATGYYALGRVHSAAFATGLSELNAFPREGGDIVPQAIPKDQSDPSPGPDLEPWEPMAIEKLTQTERTEHLRQAISNFEKALQIGFPAEQRFYSAGAAHLSLAYVLEHGMEYACEVPTVPGIKAPDVVDQDERAAIVALLDRVAYGHEASAAEESLSKEDEAVVLTIVRTRCDSDDPRIRTDANRRLAAHWAFIAAEHYLASFRASVERDLEDDSAMIRQHPYEERISYEAGTAYIRMLDSPGVERRDEVVGEVRTGLRKLRDKKYNFYITPLVFSTEPGDRLADLIDPESDVAFDLDGAGVTRRWGWLRPRAGLLCWDPEGTGRITSGRQLFGNASWWLLFPDGYRALDALDDNRDGWLRGAELDGISAWFDRDSDGVSDPGEVVALRALGVTGVATHWDSETGMGEGVDALWCEHGIEFDDGRSLPTWDWFGTTQIDSGTEPTGSPEQ